MSCPQRASGALSQVKTAWIEERQEPLENSKIAEFQVDMVVTFVPDE